MSASSAQTNCAGKFGSDHGREICLLCAKLEFPIQKFGCDDLLWLLHQQRLDARVAHVAAVPVTDVLCLSGTRLECLLQHA